MNDSIEEICSRVESRIPERWGKWVDVPTSWLIYIGELDERLAAIDPDYVVLQCKSKFRGLRYYVENPTSEMQSIISEYERNSYDWPLDMEVS